MPASVNIGGSRLPTPFKITTGLIGFFAASLDVGRNTLAENNKGYQSIRLKKKGKAWKAFKTTTAPLNLGDGQDHGGGWEYEGIVYLSGHIL